jgi:hypothetical protein
MIFLNGWQDTNVVFLVVLPPLPPSFPHIIDDFGTYSACLQIHPAEVVQEIAGVCLQEDELKS